MDVPALDRALGPTHGLTIAVDGGDTAQSLNVHKRVTVVARAVDGLSGKRLLDCGCGAGGYAAAYAALGARVVGIEYNLDKLRASTARALDGAVFAGGDLERLPLADAVADVAVLNEVLEHVPDQGRALSELHRALRPGGQLVVLSPNRFYPFESHGVRLRHNGRRVPVYVPFIPYLPLRLGTHFFDYWARNYWPWELRGLVREAGFDVVRTGYVAQTFEGISGPQPALVRALRPLLRAAVGAAEATPLLRAGFCVSQLVVARRR
jgi:SAM-dependent methyltransferase